MTFTFSAEEDAELFPMCAETDVGHVLRNRRMRSVRSRCLDYLHPKLTPYFQHRDHFVPFLRNLRDVLGGSLLMYDPFPGGVQHAAREARPVNRWAEELQGRCPLLLAPQASFASSLAPTLQPLWEGGALAVEFNAPYIDVVFPYDAVNDKIERDASDVAAATADFPSEAGATAPAVSTGGDDDSRHSSPSSTTPTPISAVAAAPAAAAASAAPVVPATAWPKVDTSALVTATSTRAAGAAATMSWEKRDEVSGALINSARVFVPAPDASVKPLPAGSVAFRARDWHPFNDVVASPPTESAQQTSLAQQPQQDSKNASPSPVRTGAAAAATGLPPLAGGAGVVAAGAKPPQVTAWIFHVVFRGYDEDNFIQVSVAPSEALAASPLGKQMLARQQQQQQQQPQPSTPPTQPARLELIGGASSSISVRQCVVHRVVLLSTGHLLLTDAVRHKVFGRLTIPPDIVAELSNNTDNGSASPDGASGDDVASMVDATSQPSDSFAGSTASAALAVAKAKTRQFFENVEVVLRGVAPNTPTRFMALGVVALDSSVHTFQHACDADCPLSWNEVLYPELYARSG